MKVYISGDMEGITGVTDWSEVEAGGDYERFRRRYTAEIAAACEGALQAGATEILVNDAHGSGRNLLAEELPEQVRLISGWSEHPLLMVQELTREFRALLFIGYHSRAGSDGSPLCHTFAPHLQKVVM